MASWDDLCQFLGHVNFAMLGAALYYWSKPMARGINSWAASYYERFPKLKALPGSRNAGTDLNYKITYIWFRICGAFVFVSEIILLNIFLLSPHK
jgi:hypothetical protein